MRRAGRRILVDPVVGCEIARHKIDPVAARRRRDGVGAGYFAHRREVGPESGHLFSALVDRHGPAPRDKVLRRRAAERREQARIGRSLLRRPGRKIHRQQVAIAHNLEAPGLQGVECHRAPLGRQDMGHDISGGEGCVTAQLHLHRGREPAQQVALALRHKERGLGKVVLRRDRLHRRRREPLGERAHSRGIAAEQAAGESIDLVERDAHRTASNWLAAITAALSDIGRRVYSNRKKSGPFPRNSGLPFSLT